MLIFNNWYLRNINWWLTKPNTLFIIITAWLTRIITDYLICLCSFSLVRLSESFKTRGNLKPYETIETSGVPWNPRARFSPQESLEIREVHWNPIPLETQVEERGSPRNPLEPQECLETGRSLLKLWKPLKAYSASNKNMVVGVCLPGMALCSRCGFH